MDKTKEGVASVDVLAVLASLELLAADDVHGEPGSVQLELTQSLAQDATATYAAVAELIEADKAFDRVMDELQVIDVDDWHRRACEVRQRRAAALAKVGAL